MAASRMATAPEGASRQQRNRGFMLKAAALLLGVNCLLIPATRAFLAPTLSGTRQVRSTEASMVDGRVPFAGEQRVVRTATAAVEVALGSRILQAVSAGAVAAVVQALLSAVTEPIVNRVLVKRMSVGDAIAELTPAMIGTFFATTISTNLLKFPLFEAVSMFMRYMPNYSNLVRGLIVGFVFTTSTLPITNFRYRMSIQTPVAEAIKPGVLYQAYLPTVVRDMVYAVARYALTAALLVRFTQLDPSSPAMLFSVVLGGCIISAPFNEIRGFLLQSAGKSLSFTEFFKPINFVRSTSLGAINQAIAVATGYWLTPIVAKYVKMAHDSVESGNPIAFFGVVFSMDVGFWLLARAFSQSAGRSRRNEDVDGMAVKKNSGDIESLAARMAEMESMVKAKDEEVERLNKKLEELDSKSQE